MLSYHLTDTELADLRAEHRRAPNVREAYRINADSTIALMEQIEDGNPNARRITIICDNARYYRSKAVRVFLENSRIELFFLPPYSPNLNLIERFYIRRRGGGCRGASRPRAQPQPAGSASRGCDPVAS